jgi:hypothetical protein
MKTSELIGPALDWAVAKCEDIELQPPVRGQQYVYSKAFGNYYNPSHTSGWGIGGPIIERREISVRFLPDGANSQWFADMYYTNEDGGPEQESEEFGPTPLIAAMRCYVASKLGDEVEVPEELK